MRGYPSKTIQYPERKISKWNHETDVVILGTGFAGQVSAIVAHDAGTSVPMIEKASEKHQRGNS